MEKIFFQNDNKEYKCNILKVSEHIIKLAFENAYPSDIITNGFEIHNEHNNTNMSGDYYHSFNTVYRELDSCSVLLSDNGDVYVEPVVPDPEPIPEPTEEELAAQKLAEFNIEKENKIYEMRSACETTIEKGITTSEGKTYSYTVQDQSNILNAMNLAKSTGLEVPYHADGESCSLYTYDDIASIYMQEQMNLTKNQTYFNQLKLYIESVTDVKDIDLIKDIYYGTDLTGKYLDKYNEIMTQSEKVIQKLVSTN